MKTKSTLFQNGDTTMKTRIKNLFLAPALIAGLSLIPAGRVTAWTVIAINSEGANPNAGLILSNNTLYGTAADGGSSGAGTIFAVNTDGTGFRILHDFTGGSDGASPCDGLLLSGNTLYGTAYSGGSSGNGTLFGVNTDGAGFTNLYSFTGLNYDPSSGGYTNSDGANPIGGLILTNKTLYGTARFGGSSGKGTVFSRSFNLNHAPLALATVSPLFAIPQGGTNRFILSPNNADATIVLDGSQSSDADNDPLQFNWYADGQPNALTTGALATNQFAVGPHTVQLVVSDGHDTATAQVSFAVITPATAVSQLMLLVDEANLANKNQQPLLATLSAAKSAFVRGNFQAGVDQLSAFQNQIRAQVAPWNPALAGELITATQRISEVVGGG